MQKTPPKRGLAEVGFHRAMPLRLSLATEAQEQSPNEGIGHKPDETLGEKVCWNQRKRNTGRHLP